MRLTWQVVALALGTMAAAVAALKVVGDRNSESDRAVVMLEAVKRGGRLVEDGVEMPGDAKDGDYPEREA